MTNRREMKGNPLYQEGDVVRFVIANRPLIGTIHIVDGWGTWEDASDASYDIYVEQEDTLYKHIPECLVQSRVADDKYYGN